jgi:type 1 glutamine amidotransferase
MFRQCLVATLLTAVVVWALTPAARAADPVPSPTAPGAKAKILVLTGNEYPGHKWRETAPLIARFLAADRRLTTEVNADPQFLASPDLHGYDAIVLNYLNWKSPDPGPKARENLKKFLEEGKGLVIIHNACAAFGDWPEFKRIAGRAWNPKRARGHDPYGSFRVEITGVEHPITKGMKPFETTDELYTCLLTEGPPVEVLAKAVSIVDKKDYPMALVHPYGKGRVFLCVLGHDVKSLSVEAVQDLYRRGTAWAAGLPPLGP